MKKLLACFVVSCLFGMMMLPSLSVGHPPVPPPPPLPDRPIGPPPPPVVPPPPVPPPVVTGPGVPSSVVVVAPAVVVSGRATVTASVLNVRSGPGLNYPVIEQVYQGAVMRLHGNAPGWLYALLPNGQFGWVSASFTAPIP
jgi:uncharacterized protein YgiM (DUF1202 family)